MQLLDQDIHEFIAYWEEAFSERLTLEEARLHAALLFKLYIQLIDIPPNPPTSHNSDNI